MYTTEQTEQVYEAFQDCSSCGLCSTHEVINLIDAYGIEGFTDMLNAGSFPPHVKRIYENRLNCRP